jgi:hypothetical protein
MCNRNETETPAIDLLLFLLTKINCIFMLFSDNIEQDGDEAPATTIVLTVVAGKNPPPKNCLSITNKPF